MLAMAMVGGKVVAVYVTVEGGCGRFGGERYLVNKIVEEEKK